MEGLFLIARTPLDLGNSPLGMEPHLRLWSAANSVRSKGNFKYLYHFLLQTILLFLPQNQTNGIPRYITLYKRSRMDQP